jgi:hypothetical protein
MIVFNWVVSKWGLMKVWLSTPKKPILVAHPKWTPTLGVRILVEIQIFKEQL